MIYVLHGEDTFRSREKLNEISRRFQEVSGDREGMVRVDAEEADVEELAGMLETQSLFKTKQLIVVRNAALSTGGMERFFIDRAKKFADAADIYIFWEDGERREESKVFTELSTHAAKVQIFSKPSGATVARWLEETLVGRQEKLSSKEKEDLLMRAGNDLWRLAGELEKTLLGGGHDGGAMEEADSRAVFALTDAVGARDWRKAAEFLYNLLKSGILPERLFYALAWHIKNVALLRVCLDMGKDSAYAIKATKLNPFVVRKGLGQAKNFARDELVETYRNLISLDLESKYNKADMGLGLEKTILGLGK